MMKRITAILIALLLLGGCTRARQQTQTATRKQNDVSQTEAAAETAAPETTSEAAQPRPGQVDGDTAQALDALLRRYGASGAQAARIRDGSVDALYTFGYADGAKTTPVTDETKFRVASLSKTVCAMTAAAMQAQGRLDLDADAGTLLGFPVRNPRYPDTVITLRMLMTHTSSITDSADFLASRNAFSATPLRDLLAKRSSYTDAQPGKRYVYSNFGIAVLAAAAESRANASFESLAQQVLFRPAEIDASFSASALHQPELTAVLFGPSGRVQWSVARQMEDKPAAALGQTHHIYQGNLTISAEDYARLLCLLLQANDGARRLYPAQAAREILTPQFADASVTQGLCVKRLDSVVEGRSFWAHAGFNFGMFAAFVMDSADNSGVVVLTSGANAAVDGSGLPDICTEIIRTLYGVK